MKSVAQMLAESLDALETSGKKMVAQTIKQSKASLEAQLAACQEALTADQKRQLRESGRTRTEEFTETKRIVKKNLGADTRMLSESQRTGRPDAAESQRRLAESAKGLGLSEREAAIFAGITDTELTEAVKRGDTADDFWTKVVTGRP